MSVSCAVLLDRDGTLIEDKHYLSEPSGVALLPGVGPALSRLVQAGHRLFLVSNQSGVGRGYFTAWRAKNGLRNFWSRMA